jgi:hypothetical protein
LIRRSTSVNSRDVAAFTEQSWEIKEIVKFENGTLRELAQLAGGAAVTTTSTTTAAPTTTTTAP